MKKPMVSIEMDNGKIIKVELEPQEATNSVNAFINLIERNVFDNREIKRIVPGFVIQPTYTSFERDKIANIAVDGEFKNNGYDNNLTLEKKAVALGGDGKTMAGVSCFFFILSDEAGAKLDGKFTGIGKVVEGWEEIERIENVDTIKVDVEEAGVTVNEPKVAEIIRRVTVDLCGYEKSEAIIIGEAD